MRHRPSVNRSPGFSGLASVITLVAALLLSGGCSERTPFTPGGLHPAVPRNVSWGAERTAYSSSLPMECSRDNAAFWWFWSDQCGGVNQSLPLPPGRFGTAREVRVRLTGSVELEGSCGALPTGPFGPLGVPYFFAPGFSGPAYDGYGLLTTFAYLDDGFNIRRINLSPVGTDSSVVEGVIDSEVPGRGVVIQRGAADPRRKRMPASRGHRYTGLRSR